MLLPGEKIIADKGYIGYPDKIITPINEYSTHFNKEHKLIMTRHEHVNKRIKDFMSMKSTWRHGWKSHVLAFYAVVTLTQIRIENGEPLPMPYSA